MSVDLEVVRYKCDWVDEYGDTCTTTDAFASNTHGMVARDAGWGSYTNAYISRDRWTTGAQSWFCPVHATVFRNNHGWGGLESYGPPKKWWENFYRRKQ